MFIIPPSFSFANFQENSQELFCEYFLSLSLVKICASYHWANPKFVVKTHGKSGPYFHHKNLDSRALLQQLPNNCHVNTAYISASYFVLQHQLIIMARK